VIFLLTLTQQKTGFHITVEVDESYLDIAHLDRPPPGWTSMLHCAGTDGLETLHEQVELADALLAKLGSPLAFQIEVERALGRVEHAIENDKVAELPKRDRTLLRI